MEVGIEKFVSAFKLENNCIVSAVCKTIRIVKGKSSEEGNSNEIFFTLSKDRNGEWELIENANPSFKKFCETENIFIYNKWQQVLIIFEEVIGKEKVLKIHILSNISTK